MPDIFEIITSAGIEIPSEARKTLEAELRKSYKHISEVEQLKEQLKTATDGLTAANTEIERFKGLDIEGVQKAASEWKTKYEESEAAGKARIAEMEYDAALKDALSDVKFSSEYARGGVFGEIKDKKLPIENGKIVGLDDVMKSIRESKADAFVADNQPDKKPIWGGTNKPLPGNAATDAEMDTWRKDAGLKTE